MITNEYLDEDRRVIDVSGDLDVATARVLRDRIAHRSDTTPGADRAEGSVDRDVVVDLGGIGFTDSAGLNGLILAHYDCESAGTRLTLVHVPSRLRRLLELAGLDSVLHIQPGATR